MKKMQADSNVLEFRPVEFKSMVRLARDQEILRRKILKKRLAFVEVVTTSQGPGLAGAFPSSVTSAHVSEVKAATPLHAEELARRSARLEGYGSVSVRFLRWADDIRIRKSRKNGASIPPRRP